MIDLQPLTTKSGTMKLYDALAYLRARSGDAMEALDYETRQEAASALGCIGRQLEAALEDIKCHDATPGANRDREELLQIAADKAMALMVQREAFGMRVTSDLQKVYGIPREVMVRIGARPTRKPDL